MDMNSGQLRHIHRYLLLILSPEVIHFGGNSYFDQMSKLWISQGNAVAFSYAVGMSMINSVVFLSSGFLVPKIILFPLMY